MTRFNNHANSIDLLDIARQTMVEEGFSPEFPADVRQEVSRLLSQEDPSTKSQRDLRSLLWSSIDNQSSRDLDQVEFVEQLENGTVRVLIGIADVDVFVNKGSATDRHAFENTTSVYAGVTTFPMLPEELSTNKSSLVQGEDRQAIVIDFEVRTDGSTVTSDVYPAIVHNRAKLSYEEVGRWLDQGGPTPKEVSNVPALEQQLRMQVDVANRLRELRKKHGALELATIQAMPVANEKGEVVDLVLEEPNSARAIIENFMIAANVAMAQFLESHAVVSLRRVVSTPENWPRIVEIARELDENLPPVPDSRALDTFLQKRKQVDPAHFPDLSLAIIKLLGPGEYVVQVPGEKSEGHFGLAVHNYTHSTAPNRRYADLTTQRLLKACTAKNNPPYGLEALRNIADHCTERESAARKVERKMHKVAAAMLLQNRVGDEFDGMVTGVMPKGTFARVFKPPVDGLIVKGKEGLKVGERVRLKLVSTDPRRGFIDFAVTQRR